MQLVNFSVHNLQTHLFIFPFPLTFVHFNMFHTIAFALKTTIYCRHCCIQCTQIISTDQIQLTNHRHNHRNAVSSGNKMKIQ